MTINVARFVALKNGCTPNLCRQFVYSSILKISWNILLNHIVTKRYKHRCRTKDIKLVYHHACQYGGKKRKKWRNGRKKIHKVQKRRKRYRAKYAKVRNDKVQRWWKENRDLYKAQKRWEKEGGNRAATEQQHTSPLDVFEGTDEMETMVETFITIIEYEQPLQVINFDCQEALATSGNEILDEFLYREPTILFVDFYFDLSSFDN